jgi:hypothetical protein
VSFALPKYFRFVSEVLPIYFRNASDLLPKRFRFASGFVLKACHGAFGVKVTVHGFELELEIFWTAMKETENGVLFEK